MAVPGVYVLHGIQTPTNFYSVVQDATPAPVVDAMVQFAAGHPQPLFTSTRTVKPEVTFTTHQVGTAISEFGLMGLDLSGGNVDLYYRLAADHGARVAGATTSHIRLRMVNAFGYIRTIRAAHRAEATVEIRICATYDGSNAPLVAAGGVALSGTSAAAEFYTLGPATVNTTSVGGQDASVELNPDVIEVGDEGEVFNTFVAIRTIQPIVTLRGFDVSQWANIGLTGTPLSALVVYLRRKAADGDNVANGTSAHCKVTGGTGLITIDNSNGGGNAEAQLGLRIFCRAANAAGNALTLASASAIT